MIDADITALLTYWRTQTGLTAERAARDLRLLAAEIDRQRQTASQLAEITKRLRVLAESRRKVLEHIKRYFRECLDHCQGEYPKEYPTKAIGTVVNMIGQQFDTEKTHGS